MAGKKVTDKKTEVVETTEKQTATTKQQETKEVTDKKTEKIDPIVAAMLRLNSKRKKLTKKEKQADIYAKMAKLKIIRN